MSPSIDIDLGNAFLTKPITLKHSSFSTDISVIPLISVSLFNLKVMSKSS